MKDKSAAYVQQATDAINRKHRRILQYQTAEELFKQYISNLTIQEKNIIKLKLPSG